MATVRIPSTCTVIYLRSAILTRSCARHRQRFCLAVCSLLGIIQPHSHRCDEITQLRDPLALLPVARSPSQAHCCTRWWALTPPFHPLPFAALPHVIFTTTKGHCNLAGILSVAVVVSQPLPDNCPHLRFRGATFPPHDGTGVGKFLCWADPAATVAIRPLFTC